MRPFLAFALSLFLFQGRASAGDSLVYYRAADTVKAAAFYADLRLSTSGGKKASVGIGTDDVKLCWRKAKGKTMLVMSFPNESELVAQGIGIRKKGRRELRWGDVEANSSYSLMLATASDSAGNFMLYSGYVFLPSLQKWKLIGCVKLVGRSHSITEAYSFHDRVAAEFSKAYFQRGNGSWKSAVQQAAPPPVINLASHVDSMAQLSYEKALIAKAVANGITQATQQKDDVYYHILRQGNGKAIAVTDTVSVFYKGYLLEGGAVFDQTGDKPARFPLSRLIRAWQIGIPLIRTGGKIQLVIPSALAYSIRTRSPKIPPNSILVFEIEVVE